MKKYGWFDLAHHRKNKFLILFYHPKVDEDISILDKKQRKIVAKAIENRLHSSPEKYGNLLGFTKRLLETTYRRYKGCI